MKPWYGEQARNSPRAQHLCANRGAAYWRAVVIHAMRVAGHSYRAIGQYFGISPERARQICARPLPPAQLQLPLAARLVWSRPDSLIAPFCSTCQAHIPDDEAPLMMWNNDGACVQICDRCAAQAVEVMT